MNTFLRNICVSLGMMLLLSSCAILDIPTVPRVKGEPFPAGVHYDHQGGGVAVACLRGDYTGQRIKNIRLGRASSWQDVPDRPDPAGKGKILTRYHYDTREYTDYLSKVKTKEKLGYTYTIHTTDDGIITKCSATKQLLGRW